jgi:3-oxoacyl-[acyl-carrier protein] reductase
MTNGIAVGRSVLVVGAGKGIGAAVAGAFAAAGDRVAGTHRGSGVPIDGVHPVELDVRDAESIDRAVTEVERTLGPPEIVVCNAGVTKDGLLMRMSEEQYREVVEVNQFGAFRVVRRVLPAMVKARSGSLVLISSISARLGVAGQANYSASKAALEGFARSAAREYASRGVRVNVVAPGPTDTDMVAAMTERARAAMLAEVPMGRLAQPSEIADVVRWLADSTYVTGVTVPVSGGSALGF